MNIKNIESPKYYEVKDLIMKKLYVPSKSYKHYTSNYGIEKPGQLKLLLNEIRFLTEDVEIQNYPKNTFSILYIGSGKGFHIPYLINMYKKYNINWYFYDPNGHCESLINIKSSKNSEDLKDNNINIFNDLFLEKDINLFKNIDRKLLFISDIRTSDSDSDEPKTKNLLNDYKLQNDILEKLNPLFSLIKFRYPFPDDWEDTYKLLKPESPSSKEYIQSFLKNDSNEIRLFLTSGISFVCIKKEIFEEMEQKFAWYNTTQRNLNKKLAYKDNDFIIASYIIDLYNIIENKNKDVILLKDLNIFKKIKYFKELSNQLI